MSDLPGKELNSPVPSETVGPAAVDAKAEPGKEGCEGVRNIDVNGFRNWWLHWNHMRETKRLYNWFLDYKQQTHHDQTLNQFKSTHDIKAVARCWRTHLSWLVFGVTAPTDSHGLSGAVPSSVGAWKFCHQQYCAVIYYKLSCGRL